MIYGLYLSATGVLTNSHRQDVIANNLANAETVGFKKSLSLFQQRKTEAQASGKLSKSDPTLDHIGGGLLLAPTQVDKSAGPFERTGNPIDLAIAGNGFFAVKAGDQTQVTRNGTFLIDKDGCLAMADGTGHRVLNRDQQSIKVGNIPVNAISIATDGTLSAGGKIIDRVGLFDVADESQLSPQGGALFKVADSQTLQFADGTMESGFVENSNVDPMTELTQLIESQRALEANASMIRTQDETLGQLVSQVGKIG